MQKTKGQHGGARPNSGRKAVLEKPTKVLVTLEHRQRNRLQRYTVKRKIQGMSAGVRQLIDDLEESDNAENLRNVGARATSSN